jgi:hypothetical protein
LPGAAGSNVVRYLRVLAKLVAENKLSLPLRYASAE